LKRASKVPEKKKDRPDSLLKQKKTQKLLGKRKGGQYTVANSGSRESLKQTTLSKKYERRPWERRE